MEEKEFLEVCQNTLELAKQMPADDPVVRNIRVYSRHNNAINVLFYRGELEDYWAIKNVLEYRRKHNLVIDE